jgi:hypothetical protein
VTLNVNACDGDVATVIHWIEGGTRPRSLRGRTRSKHKLEDGTNASQNGGHGRFSSRIATRII